MSETSETENESAAATMRGTESAPGGTTIDAVPLSEPEILAAAPPRDEPRDSAPASSSGGEAYIAAALVSAWTKRRFGERLTAEEMQRLADDAAPVLEKWGVGHLLPPEEGRLVATLTEILAPRVLAALEDEGADDDDRSQPREAGQREDGAGQEARAPRVERRGLNLPRFA